MIKVIAGERVYILEVDEDRRLRLPADLREELGIEPGDALFLVKVGHHFILKTGSWEIPQLLQESARIAAEQGITLEKALQGLEETGDELYEEMYGRRSVPAQIVP